ncbi:MULTISPECIES: hypothetical protein [Candidatus Ichthyocystis]|uniref:Putative coiled coil protein n=1 Tax=Candidatus Ichthyocystis hellenicum TaxID=1561003 RepID=A0A0S4M1C3_9BURK|nr:MULTISPECIES: hypothetical protein [Ichthyocystis]CUT17083.1 putative coiled coil protein [Candidatus Ichthyocystis hellenicum]
MGPSHIGRVARTVSTQAVKFPVGGGGQQGSELAEEDRDLSGIRNEKTRRSNPVSQQAHASRTFASPKFVGNLSDIDMATASANVEELSLAASTLSKRVKSLKDRKFEVESESPEQLSETEAEKYAEVTLSDLSGIMSLSKKLSKRPKNARQLTEQQYPEDEVSQDMVLQFALNLAEGELKEAESDPNSSEEKIRDLKKIRSSLMEQLREHRVENGQAIRAKFNIASAARSFAESIKSSDLSEKDRKQLKSGIKTFQAVYSNIADSYSPDTESGVQALHEEALQNASLRSLYLMIKQRFGLENIQKGFSEVVSAISADMNSSQPSIGSANLTIMLKDFKFLAATKNVYDSCKDYTDLMKKQYKFEVSQSTMTDECVLLSTESWVTTNHYHQILVKHKVYDHGSNDKENIDRTRLAICFMNAMLSGVREVPEAMMPDGEESRLKIISEGVSVLDGLAETEELLDDDMTTVESVDFLRPEEN